MSVLSKLVLSFLLWMPSVWAGQACVDKATGRLREYQSRGTSGTCTQNLTNAGIDPATFTEQAVTDAQATTLIQHADDWLNLPQTAKFVTDVMALFPTRPAAIRRVLALIPTGDWLSVQQEIVESKTLLQFAQANYDAIKASAAKWHIPITLP